MRQVRYPSMPDEVRRRMHERAMQFRNDFCRCTERGSGTRYFLDGTDLPKPCKHCGKHSRLPNRAERRARAKDRKNPTL